MELYVICKENKNGNKYLSVYKKDASGSDKFITCDFNTVKRLLGVSVYSNLNNLVKDWDINQVKEL